MRKRLPWHWFRRFWALWVVVALGLNVGPTVGVQAAPAGGRMRPQGVAVEAAPEPQAPTTFPVPNIIVNVLTLTANPNDGKCDLWEALKATFDQANFNECPSGGAFPVIGFAPAIAGGTIRLPATAPGNTDFPMIRTKVVVIGPITIDGGGFANDTHIFNVAHSGDLTLINMTLMNAYTSGSGAAVFSQSYGPVSLIGMSFTGNTVDSDGAAVYANGPVSIIGSNFSGNVARGVLSSTVISDLGGVGFGGAVYVYGYDNLKIAGSTFNGNIADKGGGALYFTGGTAEIVDTTFNGNLVQDTYTTNSSDNYDGGGAVYSDYDTKLYITRTAFSGNLNLPHHGGALALGIDGITEIADSSFNANLAGDTNHASMGGGIYNAGGILKIVRSVFIANVAMGDGGALANDRTGEVTLGNLTIAGNNAQGNGGALWNGHTLTGTLTFINGYNLTIANNTAGGAAIYRQDHANYPITLGNTIVDQGSSGCNIALTSQGHNIDRQNSCGFNAGGDQINTNPDLKALTYNGGALTALLSMALNAGSPAIGGGSGAICQAAPVSNEDQRGESRSNDSGCDVGAIENDPLIPGYGSSPVQPGPLDLGNALFDTTITRTFRISETGNATLSILTAGLSGPQASEFGISTTVPFNIADDAAGVDFQVSCTPVGPATTDRTATLTLTTNDPENISVDYTLTCTGSAAPQPGYSSDPIAPGPLSFGEVTYGTSATLGLQVAEVGSAQLTLTNTVLGGPNPTDFQVTTSFPVTIANGGAAKMVNVRCNPTTNGMRTATLTINTNDPTLPSVNYNLVCDSVPPPSPYLEEPGQSLPGGGIILNAPYGIAASPDNVHIYAAGEQSDSISVYRRDLPTGTLTNIRAIGDSAGDLDGARMILISPDGAWVYVSSYLTNTITVFARNPEDGDLTKLHAVQDGDAYGCFPTPCDGNLNGLDGAYGMALSPDGKFFYASGINDDGIVVLRRNTNDGGLRWFGGVNYVQSYISTANLDNAYGIALSPDGANLYATGYAADSLVVFSRHPTSGTITFVEKYTPTTTSGLDGVFRVIVSDDGQFVYTASFNSSSVTAFRRNPVDGRLTHLATYGFSVHNLDAVSSVALSPDGEHLYATGYLNDSLAVFARNPTTGLLQFAQRIVRNAGTGLPALDGARDVVSSPDGRMVFATGYHDDKVVAFRVANPIPTLESLLPASVQAGSAAFSLTVKGEGFVPGAVVYWGNNARPTTYINGTELRVAIPASDVTVANLVVISATNPAPGGGPSTNGLLFTISAPGSNPAPSIEALAPQGANAGDPGFTLTVWGANFIADSVVTWNGVARATTFISSTQLQATIPASDIAQPGEASVRVSNPTPGGGNSNALTFAIAAPGSNPPPSISAVGPNWAFSTGGNSSSLTLVVTGTNFVAGAVVLWDGDARPTTFVSPTALRAQIDGSDLVFPGNVGISARNPEPGGGDSNTLPFTIYTLSRQFLPFIWR